MTEPDPLLELADVYFTSAHGLRFADLTAPISRQAPAGYPLAGTGFYQLVHAARHPDETGFPKGAWEQESKPPDWDAVAGMTAQGLAERSKDLQLAAWLLEAEIHRHGFASVAPCARLIQALLDDYWEQLYPLADGGDTESRANIVRWIDQRLPAPLRLVPFTSSGSERGELNWADWERAERNSDTSDLLAAVAATPTEVHRRTCDALQAADRALVSLRRSLARHFGDDAPSVDGLAGLLAAIRGLTLDELGKRGAQRPGP